MKRNIEQWVEYIQTLHFREIELSLERVREVYCRMYPEGVPFTIISLSGTNGKGSTAELLASIYRHGGYRVGKFTSPHLVRFNERFNLNGDSINDSDLLEAFESVEHHRRDTPITFFEYGTLLAIELFVKKQVDVAVMEVGLGGRLDSVNILDADVSIVTSVSIDHTSWLGDTIDKIAYEKAGIARAESPFIIGLQDPPHTLLDYARNLGAVLRRINVDFRYSFDEKTNKWKWSNQQTAYTDLPLPFKQSGVQLSNCSLALEAVSCLSQRLPVKQTAVQRGIDDASILGRCQVIQSQPQIVLDVSHNQTSVARLSQFLSSIRQPNEEGRLVAVCGMLKDKEISQSLAQISDQIDIWHTASIHNERGATAGQIAKILNQDFAIQAHRHENVISAYQAALASLTNNDCLVVFGSFHVVGDIIDYLA